MTRIGASISGFERQLLNQLSRANAAAAVNSLRLATGKQVFRPADDPAAFMQISSLESELSSVQQTTSRITAASNVAAQTQLTLDQILTQLNTIRSALLTDETGSLDSATRAATQVDIDTAIDTLNTLTGFDVDGKRPLDGTSNFQTTGVNSSQIRDLQVYSIGAGTGLGPVVSGSVTTAAEQATLVYTGTSGQVAGGDTATFTLTGERGATTVSTTAGEALTDVRDRINADSHKTGITASVSGDDLTFTAVDYGSQATIAVAVSSGTFAVTGGNGDGTAQGVDAVAQIDGLTISGANGNRIDFNQNGLKFSVEFAAGFSGTFDTVQISDETALKFAITPEPHRTATLGLPSLHAARLGGLSGTLDQLATGKSLAGLAGNVSQAIRVVDEAIAQVTLVEGRVDAFADITIASSSALMAGFETEIQESLTALNGVDANEESLLLSKNQALASNSLSALAVLDQQRQDVLGILRLLAGL